MIYSIAATLVLILHLLFICFVVVGGFMAMRRRWILALHLPAMIWAVLLEYQDWICPLTPIEQQLRSLAGEASYTEGFIDYYLMSLLYPDNLTPAIQMILGSLVLMINLIPYGWILRRTIKGRQDNTD